MDKVLAADSGEKGIFASQTADDSSVEKEMGQTATDTLTTENVFKRVMDLLNEMGFRSLSVEKSEDFTERIDAVFTRRNAIGEPGSSGYLRILTVYRIGKKLHVELYNFLRKFPSDGIEMSEVKKAIRKLFGRNRRVKMHIHE